MTKIENIEEKESVLQSCCNIQNSHFNQDYEVYKEKKIMDYNVY
jgi:hypothetical protein